MRAIPVGDFRQALRLFRHRPGFAASVVLTLSLGIGLTAATFSVVDGVVLRPLPYVEPSRLVVTTGMDGASLAAWRRDSTALSRIGAYDASRAPLVLAGAEAARLRQVLVSSNLLDLLGVRPALGRGFRAEDALPGAEPVVVLTHGVWRDHFGARSDVVGELAAFEPKRLRVIGVLAATAVLPMPVGPFGPARILTVLPDGDSPSAVIGRLRDGATLAQARAEERTIARLEPPGQTRRDMVLLADSLLGAVRPPLLLLLAAVGCLLLIACANAGSLLYARGLDARREHAIRLALGASPRDLVRLGLIQSCVLSVSGGICGVLLAYWSFDALLALVPAPLPRRESLAIDIRTASFAAVLSVVCGMVAGAAPALAMAMRTPRAGLQLDDRTATSPSRIRHAVLAAEVALAVVLLSAAGIAANSFGRLLRTDLGFDDSHVLSLRLRGPDSRYPTPDRQRELLDRAATRLAALPGVASVGVVDMLPVTRAVRGGDVTDAESGTTMEAELRVVGFDYFDTLGIAVMEGRTFASADDRSAPPVAVVNDALARRLWPGTSAVGRRIRDDAKRPAMEVVGVVRDVRTFAVARAAEPQYYVPHTQTSFVPPRIVLRSVGDPAALAAAVRHELRALEPAAPIEELQPLATHVAASIAQPRFQAWLLGLVGVSGMLLVNFGIAGLVSYTVARRIREVGIRVALGARPAAVVRAIAGSSVAAIGVGLAVGLAAAVALGRAARILVYEIEPNDPVTLGAVAATILTTSAMASFVPLRRALRVDPIVTLRAE